MSSAKCFRSAITYPNCNNKTREIYLLINERIVNYVKYIYDIDLLCLRLKNNFNCWQGSGAPVSGPWGCGVRLDQLLESFLEHDIIHENFLNVSKRFHEIFNSTDFKES